MHRHVTESKLAKEISIEPGKLNKPGSGKNFLKRSLIHAGNEAGVVVFSPENRNERHNHNQTVADFFNKNRLAALLPSISHTETKAPADIMQLADRLEAMAMEAQSHPETENLPIGYYASGESAPAALIAAGRNPEMIKATVIRGGRPDQDLDVLPLIKAPTLLIAPGRDAGGLRSHQRALEKLNPASSLNVVSRASFSFQEPGVLEEAAQLAVLWFLQHLG